MKKLVLMAFVLGIYSMTSSAANERTNESAFSHNANSYIVADNNDVQTSAIQRKFTSKRALNTRRFSDAEQKEYNEDSAWVGATQKFEERPEANHGDRLNRLFKSRRAYRQ